MQKPEEIGRLSCELLILDQGGLYKSWRQGEASENNDLAMIHSVLKQKDLDLYSCSKHLYWIAMYVISQEAGSGSTKTFIDFRKEIFKAIYGMLRADIPNEIRAAMDPEYTKGAKDIHRKKL